MTGTVGSSICHSQRTLSVSVPLAVPSRFILLVIIIHTEFWRQIFWFCRPCAIPPLALSLVQFSFSSKFIQKPVELLCGSLGRSHMVCSYEEPVR